MVKEAVGIGDTIEKAKEDACKKLGVESYEAEFEVLELPVKKTLGLFGGSPAKVRAYIETSPAQHFFLHGRFQCGVQGTGGRKRCADFHSG